MRRREEEGGGGWIAVFMCMQSLLLPGTLGAVLGLNLAVCHIITGQRPAGRQDDGQQGQQGEGAWSSTSACSHLLGKSAG